MNVEKRDAFAFAKRPACNVEQFAANLLQTADRNMPGNQRVRHTVEPSLLQVDVSAANLRDFDFEQR
jgi:hypothetical protein